MDDLPLHQAIELYYEKHHALRTGNLAKLIALKNEFPQIFNQAKDHEIRDIILYAKGFQETERYKELRRIALQEQLVVIQPDKIEE